jgi:tetratricopeptide (TPR) repeat protein
MSCLTLLTPIKTLQQRGALVEAVALCQHALTEHPHHPALLALLGVLHCQQQHFEQGRERLQALQQLPTETLDAETLTDLAAIHLLLKEPAPALHALNQALNQQPDFYLATARRGLVLMQLGHFADAQSDLLAALPPSPAPQQAAMHINIARCALFLGDNDTALAHIDQARLLGGGGLEQWLVVAVDAYVALQRWDEAETAIQWAQEAGLEALKCVKLLALVLAGQDKHDQAAHSLRQALSQHPDDIDLLMQLATIVQVQGHFGEAVRHIQTATQLEPENASLWVRLAQLGKKHFDERGALAAAEKALALTENETGLKRAEALVAIASVTTDESQAEHYYQQALGLVPDFVAACLGLGHLLLQWGRIDEAVAYFETAAARNPVAGFDALINARRFPEDPQLLAHIEKIAYLPSLQGAVSCGLLFDLAAVWEHHKDYDQAFRYVDEANKANRQFLPYNAEQHRQHCLAIRRTFTREFFARTADYGNPSIMPTFVLGMPRSGTTLVEQILGGHPAIFVASEIGIMSNVIQKLNAWERHLGSGLHYPDCVRDLTREQAGHFAKEVLEELRQYAPEARHIVDKLPHNFEHIGLIRLLFPNAPIIHVLREPRDVAVSNYFTDYQAKFSGMGFAYDLTDIAGQLLDYQALMHHWDEVCAKPVLTIRYEDVVADTEAAARKILAYLELAWTDAVLNYQNLERAVKTASVWQVRQPIYSTSTEKWRRYARFLEPLELALSTTQTDDKPEPIADTLPAGYFFQGMGHLQTGDLEQAATVFNAILHQQPHHAAALHMLGIVRFQQGQAQAALPLLQLAIAKQPFHAGWHQNLSVVCHALGMTEAAHAAEQHGQLLKSRQSLQNRPPEQSVLINRCETGVE